MAAQLHQPLSLKQPDPNPDPDLDPEPVTPCCGLKPQQDGHSWLDPKVMENLPVSFQRGEEARRWSEVSGTPAEPCVCVCVSAVCSLQGGSWRCWLPLGGAADLPADPPAAACRTELPLRQQVGDSSSSSTSNISCSNTSCLPHSVMSSGRAAIGRLCRQMWSQSGSSRSTACR